VSDWSKLEPYGSDKYQSFVLPLRSAPRGWSVFDHRTLLVGIQSFLRFDNPLVPWSA
jgi:hypothetical protein